MQLSEALATIEYKIATESENYAAGKTLKIDINKAWPPLHELSDAASRKFPHISLSYDHQANGIIQLLISRSTK